MDSQSIVVHLASTTALGIACQAKELLQKDSDGTSMSAHPKEKSLEPATSGLYFPGLLLHAVCRFHGLIGEDTKG